MNTMNPISQVLIDENPFEGLRVSDDTVLNGLLGRHPCPKCGKSRKYYCYSCYIPITELDGKLPRIKLPIKIDIIKHKHEIDGKSTSAHAAIIAPEDVRVYTYPDIPDYKNEKVILIFPSSSSIETSQLFHINYDDITDIKPVCNVNLPKGYNKTTLMKHSSTISQKTFEFRETKQLPVTKAIFIDSTWSQSKGIYKDDRLNTLPSVVLQNRISQFWRHQKGSPRWYLATIEAIHQFLMEIHINSWGLHPEYTGLVKCFNESNRVHLNNFLVYNHTYLESAYNGQYDNLLFFFKHMYYLIHSYYEHETLYAYKRRLT